VRSFIPDLPRGDAKDLKPNTDFPSEGGVVIFKFNGEDLTSWHIAYILYASDTRIKIAEGWAGQYRERFVPLNETTIYGFYIPSQSG
jgi:hypothetical protein